MSSLVSWFQMAGTQYTYQYLVFLRTRRGRIGVRALGGHRFRVRVEPQQIVGRTMMTPFIDLAPGEWRQPGSQRRFSIVVSGFDALRDALRKGSGALTRGVDSVWFNPDLDDDQVAAFMEWIDSEEDASSSIPEFLLPSPEGEAN